MRVTKVNVCTIRYYARDERGVIGNQKLLTSLLDELADINFHINGNNYESAKMSMFIDYEDKHTVYSPERTDPCPDMYGFFTLRWENEPSETVGDYLTLEELDTVLCVLNDVLERKTKKQ